MTTLEIEHAGDRLLAFCDGCTNVPVADVASSDWDTLDDVVRQHLYTVHEVSYPASWTFRYMSVVASYTFEGC